MSKKTRSRRGPAARSPAAGKPDVPGLDDQSTLVGRVLSSLWTAIAAGDPLQVELATAASMTLPRVGQLDPDQVEAFRAKVLVNEAIERWSPEGAAFLRLLMLLGSPRVKRAAGQALAEMTGAGIYPPDWVNQAGRAVPGQARRRYDVFGDDEVIVVTFRYGETEHGLMVQVDLTGLPVVIGIGVASDGAGLIEAIERESDPCDRTEPISLADARRLLDGPLALCDQEPDPGLSLESLASLPIARSRVRRLPSADTAQGPAREFTAADRAAAVDEFMNSPQAAEAVAADSEATRFWAEVLTGYSSEIPGGPPAQVGPRRLARVLIGHVPATFDLSPAQRRHLEPAVTGWTRWSAAHQNLDEAATARLVEQLAQVLGSFDEAYEGPDAVAARGYLPGPGTSDAGVAGAPQAEQSSAAR